MTLEALPDELLEAVCSWLSAKHLCRLSMSCRLLRERITESPWGEYHWEQRILREWPPPFRVCCSDVYFDEEAELNLRGSTFHYDTFTLPERAFPRYAHLIVERMALEYWLRQYDIVTSAGMPLGRIVNDQVLHRAIKAPEHRHAFWKEAPERLDNVSAHLRARLMAEELAEACFGANDADAALGRSLLDPFFVLDKYLGSSEYGGSADRALQHAHALRRICHEVWVGLGVASSEELSESALDMPLAGASFAEHQRLSEAFQRRRLREQQLRREVSELRGTAVLSEVRRVLFREWGFGPSGPACYYELQNSLLSELMRSRRGIPITLCALFNAVAQRVGLNSGVSALSGPREVPGLHMAFNAPCHFVLIATVPALRSGRSPAGVEDPVDAELLQLERRGDGDGELDQVLIDCYDGGRLLTKAMFIAALPAQVRPRLPPADSTWVACQAFAVGARVMRNIANVEDLCFCDKWPAVYAAALMGALSPRKAWALYGHARAGDCERAMEEEGEVFKVKRENSLTGMVFQRAFGDLDPSGDVNEIMRVLHEAEVILVHLSTFCLDAEYNLTMNDLKNVNDNGTAEGSVNIIHELIRSVHTRIEMHMQRLQEPWDGEDSD